jgi:hypothetical protein
MIFAFLKAPPYFIRECGAYNGYVGWTLNEEGNLQRSYQDHRSLERKLIYEKSLDSLINVHGGITFDETNMNIESFAPEVWLTDPIGSFEGTRIIGFDTCHAGDGPELDEAWCRRETMYLLDQIKYLLGNSG